MPINDDDAAAHGGGGPLKYWLGYRLSVLGGLKGQWLVLAIAIGAFVAGHFA